MGGLDSPTAIPQVMDMICSHKTPCSHYVNVKIPNSSAPYFCIDHWLYVIVSQDAFFGDHSSSTPAAVGYSRPGLQLPQAAVAFPASRHQARADSQERRRDWRELWASIWQRRLRSRVVLWEKVCSASPFGSREGLLDSSSLLTWVLVSRGSAALGTFASRLAARSTLVRAVTHIRTPVVRARRTCRGPSLERWLTASAPLIAPCRGRWP